jgi:flagellar basal-body rod protein FlgG
MAAPSINWVDEPDLDSITREPTMIRALYTAASGMNAQQSNIDNIAHNLANVNTTGYKKSRVEFEDLVYQEMRAAGSAASATTEAPVGLEIGLGTRAVATARNFSAGNLRATGAPLDIAIEGDGFFKISLPNGNTGYSRAGALHLDAQGLLVTAEGYGLEPQITIPNGTTTISISKDGIVSATVAGDSAAQTVGTIELATFANTGGLRPLGGNLFEPTTASGEPEGGAPGTDSRGTLVQGFLEDSNVSVVEEMVNMIIGQRAYEANSRVIKAADEMLGQVNTLVR